MINLGGKNECEEHLYLSDAGMKQAYLHFSYNY